MKPIYVLILYPLGIKNDFRWNDLSLAISAKTIIALGKNNDKEGVIIHFFLKS